MKLQTKPLSVLLALFILLSFAACAKKPAHTESTSGIFSESDSSNALPEAEKNYTDLEKIDFGGEDFKILTREIYNGLWNPLEWDSEGGKNATIISQSVYDRNTRVEEDYCCQIVQVPDKDYLASAMVEVACPTGAFDLTVMPITHQINSMAVNGYCYDYRNIDTISLEDPWWDSYTNNNISLLGHYYTICGDVNIIDDMATWCVLFNKDNVADLLNDENQYELVSSGKWTLEKMYQNVKDTANKDLGFYGLITEVEASVAFLTSGGYVCCKKDDMGIPVNNMTRVSFLEAVNRVYDYMKQPDIQLYGDNKEEVGVNWGKQIDTFVNGMGLYYTCTISNIMGSQMSNMEIPFGIIPIPKYDETQTEYVSTFQAGNATGISILAKMSPEKASKVGAILSAMSAASVDTLTEAFYETTLKRKKAQDVDSRDCLELILSHREVDIGYVISNNARNIIRETIITKTTFSFANIRQKYLDGLKNDIDVPVKNIQNNFQITGN